MIDYKTLFVVQRRYNPVPSVDMKEHIKCIKILLNNPEIYRRVQKDLEELNRLEAEYEITS